MCGISGFLHLDTDRKASAKVIKRMTDIMTYRGPDGEGFCIKDNLAFGHRRLAIIDLNTGEQPMYSVDNTIVVVFNGEIYNYLELKRELQDLGCYFRTDSDTEIIINAYRIWGNDCQNHFNGMWAFALWDDLLKRLLISRDRIGEKPLYYAVYDNTLVFASEIKGILSYGVPKIPNLELLEIYLSLGYIPTPFTFFKDIHKLKAGHYLIASGENISVQQYWDLPEIDESDMYVNKKDVYEHFGNLLRDSVKLRMKSDVAYGAFLSGGLDSSSVVALMSEISSYPIETFTIGFNDKAYDERDLAKEVAERFYTNHHEQIVEPDTFTRSLYNIIHHYDEPFGDSSAIPTGQVSKFASSKVKMVLTGDGGDELLSGYGIYQTEKFSSYYQSIPGPVRRSIPNMMSWISKPFKNSIRYKLNWIQDIFYSANLGFEDRYLSKASFVDLPTLKLMTKGEKVYPVEDFVEDFMSKCSYRDPFYKLMYLNLKLSLPDDMLVKVDRMSMAYSLETRAPFLDHRLVEYMVRVHKNIKMNNFERKTILRQSVGKKLPLSLLKAPKRGFSVPLHQWFKDDSFKDSLRTLEKSIPYLNNKVVSSVIRKNASGEKNYGNFIWMLYVLDKTLADLQVSV